MKPRTTGSPLLLRRIGTWALGMLVAGSALQAQTVTVPLEQYDRLRAKAYPPVTTPPPADTGVSFEAVEFRVEVGEAEARVTAKASLWLHGEGWQGVPWPTDLPLLALRAPTVETRLVPEDTTRRLEIRGRPGSHQVELESAVAVEHSLTTTPAATFLRVPSPWAARVGGTVTTPGVVAVTAEGGDTWVERAGPDLWRFVATPGSSAVLTLAGAPTAVAPERPLRYDVTTTTALAWSRTRRQAEVWLAGQVIEGRLERLSMPVPADFEVVAVEGGFGTGEVGWEVANGRLEVLFPGIAPKDWMIHVTLAADAAEESAVPLLLPAAARRTFVVTKAEARGGGILEPASGSPGRPVEPNEDERLPEPFRQRVGEALVASAEAPAPRWRVTWPQGSKVLGAQVDRLLVDVLVGEHGRAFYQVWAVVRANGAPDLGLELPAGARLVASRRDGVPARLGQRGSAWVGPLVSREEAQILFWAAEVNLPWPADGGRLEIPVPAATSPISTVDVRAGLPGNFRYEWLDPSRRGELAGVPQPRIEASGVNELGRQLFANTAQKVAAPGEGDTWQPLPAGFTVLEASWSSLDLAPSPLVLTVRRTEETRR